MSSNFFEEVLVDQHCNIERCKKNVSVTFYQDHAALGHLSPIAYNFCFIIKKFSFDHTCPGYLHPNELTSV